MADSVRKLVIAGAWAALVAVAGCDTRMTVQRYPEFYTPQLKTVAVLPFVNDSLNPEAGRFATDRVAAALKANGTYTVLDPRELKARLDAAGIALPPATDAAAVREAIRRLGDVQAYLTGRVAAFSADTYTRVDTTYGYAQVGNYGGWGRRRGWGYGGGTTFPIYSYSTYSQAYVALSARLTETAGGDVLHATVAPVSARATSRDAPPPTLGEMLGRATDQAAGALVGQFAIAPVTVKVRGGRDLRTARRLGDGTLKNTNDFRADEPEMVVVLHLPPAADRNAFRLAVWREHGQRELAGAGFTWSRGGPSREFVFSPRQLAEAAGKGDYEVRFLAGTRTVMRAKFKIK